MPWLHGNIVLVIYENIIIGLQKDDIDDNNIWLEVQN